MSSKWLEFLKQVAPLIERVAVLRDPSIPTGAGQFGAIQSAAASFKVELLPINLRVPADVEQGLANFAQRPGGGFIVTANPFAIPTASRSLQLPSLAECDGLTAA